MVAPVKSLVIQISLAILASCNQQREVVNDPVVADGRGEDATSSDPTTSVSRSNKYRGAETTPETEIDSPKGKKSSKSGINSSDTDWPVKPLSGRPGVAANTVGRESPRPSSLSQKPNASAQTNKNNSILQPESCTGSTNLAADDFVLFAGEHLSAVQPNVFAMVDGWRVDEAWGNGRLELVQIGASAAISFGNEGIYHGFKFTPPTVNGIRRNFTVRAADVYIQIDRVNPTGSAPTFGLRLIKPGEFEGNGGAPTTTWMLAEPNGGTRFIAAPSACARVRMFVPQGFLAEQAVANRLIWEMQSNWSSSDQLLLKAIVLRGFRYIP